MNGTSRSNRFSSLMYQYLDVVFESMEECACTCPFCSGKSSLQFNDVKGLWICFKCQESGSAKKLVKMLQGTYTEPEVELAQITAELRALGRRVDHPMKPLPESYLARFRQPGGPSPHWIDRGFNEETCARWELGHDFLNDSLTLPYRDPFSGQLAGIIFRAIGEVEGPRYKFPLGFPRNISLHGSWLVQGDAICIVEGPTDAIAVGQAEAEACSQYGSSISTGQIRLLHRLGVHRVVMFYDYDRAGLRATQKGMHLAEMFDVERVVYDRDIYCWHSYMCGCVEGKEDHDIAVDHTSAGNCSRPRSCKCGRIHEPDPGSLETKIIDDMLGRTVGV